jgi:hypothetical protein
MATWTCANDGVEYAIGAPQCPQCGASEHYETGSPEHIAALGGEPSAGDGDQGWDQSVDPVPTGSAEDVLAWVGDDPDRAKRALATEQAAEKPRVTLVDKLTKLTGQGDAGTGASTEGAE